MQSLSAVKAASLTNSAGPFAFRMPRPPAPDPTDHIDQIGTEVPFPRNGQFYCEGEPATYLYRIISGVARSYRMTTDGRRQIVAFYVAGDLFGFEASDTHMLSTEAITDTRVRMVKRAAMMNMAAEDDDVARQLWLCVGCEIRRNQEHILQFGRPAVARVASFLLDMSRRMPNTSATALSISRQDIADFLDLRIETVSRIMTRFARSGAISLSNNRKVSIRNPKILAQLIA
jgi:CRP/FNR family transcriptional regulator, nitrogen fixation regulation protein